MSNLTNTRRLFFNLTNSRSFILWSTLITLIAMLLVLTQSVSFASAQTGENDYFNVPNTAFEEQMITLEWHVANVDSVKIEHINGLDLTYTEYVNDIFNRPSTGVLTFTLDAAQQYVPGLPPHVDPPKPTPYSARFILTAGDKIFERSVSVMCAYQAFFQEPIEPSDSEICVSEPRVFEAAYQPFENGFMLFDHAGSRITIFTYHNEGEGNYYDDDNGNYGQYRTMGDNFEHGVDMISDPTIVPPYGKYQPEYGFGKVWREVEGIRDSLGWATTPAVDYEAVSQYVGEGEYAPQIGRLSPPHYTRLGDGSVWTNADYAGPLGMDWPGDVPYPGLVISSSYVSKGSNGYAHPTNGIRVGQQANNPPTTPTSPNTPTSPGGQPCPASGVWPAGCNPNLPTSPTTPTSPAGQPCPASGVWPAGCNPNLPTSPTTPTSPGGQPCPTSGVWPAGCVPGGLPSTPTNPNQCVIPASGPWPDCATAGDPPPPTTSTNCVIPPSGPWPPCARGN